MAWQIQIKGDARGVVHPEGVWGPAVYPNGVPEKLFATRADAEAHARRVKQYMGGLAQLAQGVELIRFAEVQEPYQGEVG